MSQRSHKKVSIFAQCPHCERWLEVIQLNCRIFRHGNLPPHAPKAVCDAYARNPRNPGCGKPFRVVKGQQGKPKLIKCGYV